MLEYLVFFFLLEGRGQGGLSSEKKSQDGVRREAFLDKLCAGSQTSGYLSPGCCGGLGRAKMSALWVEMESF